MRMESWRDPERMPLESLRRVLRELLPGATGGCLVVVGGAWYYPFGNHWRTMSEIVMESMRDPQGMPLESLRRVFRELLPCAFCLVLTWCYAAWCYLVPPGTLGETLGDNH